MSLLLPVSDAPAGAYDAIQQIAADIASGEGAAPREAMARLRELGPHGLDLLFAMRRDLLITTFWARLPMRKMLITWAVFMLLMAFISANRAVAIGLAAGAIAVSLRLRRRKQHGTTMDQFDAVLDRVDWPSAIDAFVTDLAAGSLPTGSTRQIPQRSHCAERAINRILPLIGLESRGLPSSANHRQLTNYLAIELAPNHADLLVTILHWVRRTMLLSAYDRVAALARAPVASPGGIRVRAEARDCLATLDLGRDAARQAQTLVRASQQPNASTGQLVRPVAPALITDASDLPRPSDVRTPPSE